MLELFESATLTRLCDTPDLRAWDVYFRFWHLVEVVLGPKLQDFKNHDWSTTSRRIAFDKSFLFDRSNPRGYYELTWVQRFLLSVHYENCTVPVFYIIPKVHKPRLVGRPIVSSLNWITTPAARLLSLALQPLVLDEPTILQDSFQLILELERLRFDPGAPIWFVTGDVESLYTNIPTDEVLDAIDWSKVPPLGPPDQTVDPRALLQCIFAHTIFRYGRRGLRQINGFPMGIGCAPECANLYMAHIEREVRRPPAVKLFKRYIDDYFIIFQGTLEQLDAYLELYNRLRPSIRITWNKSYYSFDFLDIRGYKGLRWKLEGRIDTYTFQKPLNRYLYLTYRSFHLPYHRKSFIRGELYRYVKLSSDLEAFLETKKEFFYRLRRRGYPVTFLNCLFKTVRYERSRVLPRESRSTPGTTPQAPQRQSLQVR